ncbi:MAG: glycyl-radical enzyme activating protein [bacterium]|nr:glycyl-radical enzyme activating protein [bacterium]
MKGILFDIKRFAIHDGPGIRTTVFLKGCPLKCLWCHNPESINPAIGGGFGEYWTVSDVMREIEKEMIFYNQSGGGVTFSGGEPGMQPLFLKKLLERCKEKNIHTALDTSGCMPGDTFDRIDQLTDLYLYDLKIMDDALHKKYTGISNSLCLENLQRLSAKNKDVIIRFPVIPAITDGKENIAAVASFVASLENIHRVELLPFHNTGGAKYKRLNMEDTMEGVPPLSKENIQGIKNVFIAHGLQIKG